MDRYLARLPERLLQDYGHGGPYRPKQVEATIGRYREFSQPFHPYAQALFCEQADVQGDWQADGRKEDYLPVACWLCRAYFGGARFNARDVAKYATGPSDWLRDDGASNLGGYV